MYPWQDFAIQPDFSDKIALHTTQGDVLTWIELTTKINKQWLFFTKKRRKCRMRLLLWEKIQRKFYFYIWRQFSLAQSFRHKPCFSTRKITKLCEFYQIDFLFYDEDLRIFKS